MTTIARPDGLTRLGLVLATDRDGAALAESFRKWLVHAKGIAGSSILAAVEGGAAWRTRGARASEIDATAAELVLRGRGETDELFALFVGEGALASVPGQIPENVLLGADGRGIVLSELQEKLARALGPGRHYWLIETAPAAAPPEPPSLSLASPGDPEAGAALVHSLFSPGRGSWAAVDTQFSDVIARVARAGEAERETKLHAFVTWNYVCTLLRERNEDESLSLEVRPRSSSRTYRFVAPPVLVPAAVAHAVPASPYRPGERGLSRPG